MGRRRNEPPVFHLDPAIWPYLKSWFEKSYLGAGTTVPEWEALQEYERERVLSDLGRLYLTIARIALAPDRVELWDTGVRRRK